MKSIWNFLGAGTVSALSSKSDTTELIEQIHNEFLTAGDKLLAEANSILSNLVINEEEKIKQLESLGFANVKEVQDRKFQLEIKRTQESKAQAIISMQKLFPTHKYITEEAVKTICKKYNLVFGTISQYTGFVPKKNLDEISTFYQLYPDYQYDYWERYGYDRGRSGSYPISKHSFDIAVAKQAQLLSSDKSSDYNWSVNDRPSKLFKSSKVLNICAPLKDMNTQGHKLDGHKLVKDIPDPVVLLPVSTGGYIIITAWGDEASDPLVTNEKLN